MWTFETCGSHVRKEIGGKRRIMEEYYICIYRNVATKSPCNYHILIKKHLKIK
jgi:hypothetical protein